MKIYTKNGDQGETYLASGEKISKGNHLIDLYGEVDELNSFIGMSLAQASLDSLEDDLLKILEEIQKNLFVVGSHLATTPDKRQKMNLPQLDKNLTDKMEETIDVYTQKLPPINFFILPKGTLLASFFHVSRSITRRVERKLITHQVKTNDILPEGYIIFFNRLSDLFFTLARYSNIKAGLQETRWH